MKKFNLYFWLIALAAMITSCSQDETTGLQADESNLVTIGAAVNQGIQTRAASVTIPDGYKLRYVLEVWSTGENAACIYRYEKPGDNAQAVEFTFNLTTTGNYKALLWADYVTKTDNGAPVAATASLNAYTHYTDVHYTTTSNLKNISLTKTGTNYVINDESRDAFFKCMDIMKGVGAFEESVELTRPFGQINVIERTTDLLAKVASMTLTYKVPKTFNVANGTVGTTVEVKPTVLALPTATADRKANLFYDFVFAPIYGQTTLESIAMTFTSSDNSLLIEDFSIPANMPVEHNKRTNITGSIIHTSTTPSDVTKLSVTVSDGWTTPGEDIELPSVGDYFYSDGIFSSTEQAGKTLAGIVFWTDPDNRWKGKIVSLDQIGHLDQSGKGVIWTDAQNTTSANPLPEGMTWRLPTKVELQHLWCAYNGAEPTTWVLTKDAPQKNTTANAAFGSKLTGKFGNYYYWSSEEDADNTDNAWNMTFSNGNTESSKKTRQNRVRWVSDF